MGVGVGVGVGVGEGVGVSSMNFGEGGFGGCAAVDDVLKPVWVELIFGETKRTNGFDIVRSDSFFIITLVGRSCCCDITRTTFFAVGPDGFSLFIFDESFVSVNGVEHDAQIIFAGSIIAGSIIA